MSGDERCSCGVRPAHGAGMAEGCTAAFLLMPPEVASTMPRLYAQDGRGEQAVAYVKLFTPGSSYTWYVTEYDPVERRAFGLVVADFTELGYFDLGELEELRYGPGQALRVERDLWFTPTTVAELRRGVGT